MGFDLILSTKIAFNMFLEFVEVFFSIQPFKFPKKKNYNIFVFPFIAKPRKLRKLPQGIAQPSRLKSTQIYSKSISSIPSSKAHGNSSPKASWDSSGSESYSYSPPQEALINPHHNLIESQSFFTRREPIHISQTDIRTLFQVRVCWLKLFSMYWIFTYYPNYVQCAMVVKRGDSHHSKLYAPAILSVCLSIIPS